MKKLDVPFQDFRAPYLELKEEFDAAYHRFMESGWLVLGRETTAFEEEYAAYCKAAHCVGVANGLDALHLALRALDIGPGDQVIVPSNTYIATWLAVTQVGATPVAVEPAVATFNLDPTRIEEAITSRTKAILSVNLYGHPCDYDSILAITHQRGLKLIIDNAQAHGAQYKGRRVGGIADIECHSFYPSKNLGAYGEAGAVTTNCARLAEKVRILRNYGSRVRYHNEVTGYNSRIDELQAAFLRVKLRHLDEWNRRRSIVAQKYLRALQSQQRTVVDTRENMGEKQTQISPTGALGSSPVDSQPKIVLPSVAAWATPVWHLFVIRHPHRDALQKHFADLGIQTIIHYPIPPHLSGAYAHLRPPLSDRWQLPIAEQLAGTVLSLPIGPHLRDEQVEHVSAAIGGE